jgi:hypothetical protein
MTIYVSTLTFCTGIEITEDQAHGPFYYGAVPIAWIKYWLDIGGTDKRQRVEGTITITRRR